MFEANSEQTANCADAREGYGIARPTPLFGLGSFVRHRRMIWLSGALVLALGLLFAAFRPTTYTASTQLLVYIRELQPGPETVILPGRADLSVVQNQIEIIQSRSVLLRVVDALNLKDDPEFASHDRGFFQSIQSLFVSPPSSSFNENRLLANLALDSLKRKLAVRRIGTSHIITISVITSEPTKAARIANEIAQSYLQERISAWETGLSKTPSSLRERLQGLGPSAYVISVAEPPISRDGPRSIVIVLGAAFLGLSLGAGLALFFDFMDRKIRTPEQVEFLFGLECFGIIPRLPRGASGFPNSSGDLLASVVQCPSSPLSQTLRRVRAALHGSLVRSVGVTSVVPGEGATTLSANLAHLMALSGKRVLLVDGTPGSRSLSHLMTSGVQQGFVQGSMTSLRQKGSPASRIVTDKRSGLDVFLLSGSTAANPDYVWQMVTDDFLREASESYDLVIVDLPSLASGAEARAAAQTLDAFLLVVKWDDTDSELAQRALQSSGTAQQKFFGVIINMADEQVIGKFGDKFSLAEFTLTTQPGQADVSGSTATAELHGNCEPMASS